MSRLRSVARLAVTATVAAAVAIGAPSAALAQGPEVGGSGDRFYLKNSHSGGSADISYTYGSIGDGIVVGDWDGSGSETLGVRRGSVYHLKNSHSGRYADVMYSYGTAADAVLAGDWDGDGVDTLAVRRGNTYYLKNTHSDGNADVTFSYGTSTDVVLVGDWDGDGVDTLGLRRGNRYYLKNSHTGGNADVTYSYGTTADGVVVGDWDGDGVDTLGLRRGATYFLKNTHSDGNADITYSYGTVADVIMAGDWDGNGTDTLGLRRLIVRPVTPSGVLEAQRILARFRIPVGPVDGVWGAQTAQGMCTFRQMAGLPVTRKAITTADLVKLRQYDAAYSSLSRIPAVSRNGRSTYLLAQKTCQTMLYASGGRYVRIFRISTGQAEWETPAGNFYLGRTLPGWSCSTLYPEACYDRPQGMNSRTAERDVLYSTYGNMYNKRSFLGSYLLHGSGHVPTYPASHGCIRVFVSESDWLYRNVTNAGGQIYFSVIGHY